MKVVFVNRAVWGIALLIGVVMGSGCKKSSGTGGSGGGGNGSGYYMRFKLDGVQTEYDSEPIAGITYSSSEGIYSLVIAAYKDVNAGLKNEITIIGFSKTTFSANVPYNDPAKAIETNGDPVTATTVFYNDPSANGFLTAGEFVDASGTMLIPGLVADAKLTITDLAKSYIKGSFSGTTYEASDLKTYHAITEGEFYLQRTQ